MIKMYFYLRHYLCACSKVCDNDDNEPVPGYVSAETKAAFDEKYPAGKRLWSGRRVTII